MRRADAFRSLFLIQMHPVRPCGPRARVGRCLRITIQRPETGSARRKLARVNAESEPSPELKLAAANLMIVPNKPSGLFCLFRRAGNRRSQLPGADFSEMS
jgi:hypothetical protein